MSSISFMSSSVPKMICHMFVIIMLMMNLVHVSDGYNNFDMATVELVVVDHGKIDNDNVTVTVFYAYNDCYHCLLKNILLNSSIVNAQVDTDFPMTLNTVNNRTTFQRMITYHFQQNGVYELHVILTPTAVYTEVHVIVKPTDNVFAPIAYAALILILMGVSWVAFLRGYEYYTQRQNTRDASYVADSSLAPNFPSQGPPAYGSLLMPRASAIEEDSHEYRKVRVNSLDAFRGMSLTIMIFVNYNGGGYWFFNHSKWNGLTVADLVFPWFIWIMGTAMAISFHSLQRKRVPIATVLYKICRRAAILFMLGLVVSNSGVTRVVDGEKESIPNSFGDMRIMGVLQRFAVSYFGVSLIIYFCSSNQPSRGPLAIISNHIVEWLLIFTLVGVHSALTFGLHVPGCGRGYIGPGGIGDHGEYENCTGGAAGFIDRKILGESHMYQTPTCQKLYKTGPYDPEGLLGCLTSILMCFLGVQAGRCIVYYQRHRSRLLAWSIMCVVWGAVGCGLCAGTQNNGTIPVNKNLWSLSFVIVLSSMAYFVLSVFYVLVDVWKVWNGAPWIYPGRNSIVVYCGSEFLQNNFPFTISPNSGMFTHTSMLTTNLFGVGFWVCIAFYMNYKGTFVKI